MRMLVPEVRVDKNGVAVKKYVRPADASATKRSMPAPSLAAREVDRAIPLASESANPNRKLEIRSSFQLDSLGAERDLEDAAYIRADLALAVKRYRSNIGKAYARSKSLLVDEWQEARLPTPIHARIRPVEYPWSETARDLFFGGKTTGSLKLEHVKPVKHLVQNVLYPAVEDPEMTDEMFLELLITEHSRLSFTVVTEVEDNMINKAGLRHTHVESDDDWERYKKSGIDTSSFMALVDDERFKEKTMTKVWGGKRLLVTPDGTIVS